MKRGQALGWHMPPPKSDRFLGLSLGINLLKNKMEIWQHTNQHPDPTKINFFCGIKLFYN